MKLKNILGILCLVVIPALGCSEDDAQDVIDATTNAGEDPSLQGTFVGRCYDAGFISASTVDSYKFEGNTFVQTSAYYGSNDCAQDSRIGELRYEGEFTIDSDSDAVQNGGAVNVTLQKAVALVDNQTFADLLNGVNYCGKSDYAPGAEVTLGAAETDNIICFVDEVPSTKYGAYTVENNTLYLNPEGLQGMSDSEEERPTAVRVEEGFTE